MRSARVALVGLAVLGGSCLEGSQGHPRVYCQTSHRLTLIRGQSVVLPGLCGLTPAPTVTPTWDLVTLNTRLAGEMGEGAPLALDLTFSGDDHAKTLRFSENGDADPASTHYDVLIIVNNRLTGCTPEIGTCDAASVAIRIDVFDEGELAVEIAGGPAGAFVDRRERVRLNAHVTGSEGPFAYRWEAWNLLAGVGQPGGQASAVMLADPSAAEIEMPPLGVDQYLVRLSVTDPATGAEASATRVLQGRGADVSIDLPTSATYPGTDLVLKFEKPGLFASGWVLEEAIGVVVADVPDIASDPLRQIDLRWRSLTGLVGGNEFDVGAIAASTEGLFRITLVVENESAEVVARIVLLLPRVR